MPRPRRRPTAPAVPTGMIPTRETMHQGGYEIVRLEINGPRVARNMSVTPIDAAIRRGQITPAQGIAAERIQAAWAVLSTTPKTRDPLDPSPRGGVVHETDRMIRVQMRARDNLRQVRLRLPLATWNRLIDVVVYHQRIGRSDGLGYTRLIVGLNAAAEVFGVAE